MDHRAQAKSLMTHYITLIMRAAGLQVDSDTRTELEDLVDNLIDAAKSESMQDYRHRFPKHFQESEKGSPK